MCSNFPPVREPRGFAIDYIVVGMQKS